MSFVMSDPQGGYYYTATGSLFGEDRTDWGGWRSYYSGAYKRTSAPTLQDDIRNAGGIWLDQEVVVDGNWVTSRQPGDLPAFNRAMLELFSSSRVGIQR